MIATARDTHARLLQAAAAVIRDAGLCALTLEAVAAAAGVSKGGLLYHFPSKESLLEALIEWWHEAFDELLRAPEDEGPGAVARAYLRGSATEDAAGSSEIATDRGLMAVFTGDPDRLGPVRGRYADWQARLAEDAEDPIDATIVRLAADGLWFADLYGLAAPRGETRRRVLERLEAMTRPGPGG